MEVQPRNNDSESLLSGRTRLHSESDEPIEIRRSKRRRIEKSFGPDFVVYLVEGTRDSHKRQTMVSPSIESDPLTYEEVMKSQDASF